MIRDSDLSAFQTPPHLTLITDTSRLSGEAFFCVLEQALCGGVKAVIVREKHLTSAKLLALASRIRVMTQDFQAQLIIHSQADVAAAVDADGVHLASRDMGNIRMVREWLLEPEKSVSVSCHDAEELQTAHKLGADYAMLSPVFPTMSHPGAPHLGRERFEALAAAAALPVIALGGVTLDSCMDLQNRNLAVIGAILDAEDPKYAAECLSAAVRGEGK